MLPAPAIGITLDWEPGKGMSSTVPWYGLRENYCDAVATAGGLPLMLPHVSERAGDYVTRLNGLLVSGGAFDVHPSEFGAEEVHETVTTKERRTCFEIAALKEAMARDLPILAICGGEQLLNVVAGGTLIQHIPDEVPDPLEHEQSNVRDEPAHDVRVVEGTLLHQICGSDILLVNSAHHQAVARPGPDVVVNALAADRVVEGIEVPRKRFCLGVQWHPEYHVSRSDAAIFTAFVDAARS